MSLIESPGYQAFLSVHDPHRDISWEEVKRRVIAYCNAKGKGDQERFTQLSLALAKYDLNGAPSNWEEHDHETTIFNWASWAMEGALDDEEREGGIDIIIDTLNRGFIPDCFSFLEYFY